MKEIIRLGLDNEMDLILAHRRSIKLAELCGLMSSVQTRFATAVSEIARCAIAGGRESYLVLGVNYLPGGKKEIAAVLHDKTDLASCNPEAFNYAKRLIKDVLNGLEEDIYKITLAVPIPYSGIISETRIRSFIDYFKKEAPLSAYDELRKKNIQLIELSEKLSESENNYRNLTDTLPFMIFSVSKSDKISVANKTAEIILGSNPTQFSPAEIQRIFHPGDADIMITAWENAKKKQSVQSVQARITVSTSPTWYQIYILPNADRKEEVTGWIISMVNIHAQKLVEETLKDNKELKEAQEKLRLFNDELQKKNKELEQFAYIASHDLQEPLRKIQNFISLSKHNRGDEEKQELYHSRISASADRMSRLIADVLGYSKLSVVADHFVTTDINAVLGEVQNDLEFLIRERQAVLNIGELPIVQGSRVQLSQLFYNLVSNSLKFSERTPSISLSCAEVVHLHKPYYKIVVEDNGIGIDQKYSNQIFTIFKRLHPQDVYPGTGIGLALCKKIAENHSGFIEIDSEVGKGTRVNVFFPIP